MVVPASIEFLFVLLDLTLKSCLLAALAWAGLKVARASDANLQHRVWTLVLAAMLGLPALTATLPRLAAPAWLAGGIAAKATKPTPTATEDPSRVAADSVTTTGVISASRQANASATSPTRIDAATPAPSHSLTRQPIAWSVAVVAIYLGVAACLISRVILGSLLARRLVRRSRSLVGEPRIRSAAPPSPSAIVESADVQVPVTVGVWRSAILLPCDWASWSDETLRLVMAHETIHAKRHDALSAVAAHLNAAIYWFNPVTWLLRRELANLAERVCDDEVLRQRHDRHAYAETLLAMASRLAGGRRISPPFVAMARQAQVEERIDAIIDETRPLARRLGIGRAAALGAIAAPLVALAAMLGPVAADPAEKAAAPDATAAPQPAQKDNAGEAKETAEKPAEATPTPPQRVAGRVVNDADGEPVADAEVRLSGWNKERTKFDVKTAVTDAEGRFALDELPTGNLQIIALKDDMASRTSLYKGQQVRAGEGAVELRLHPAPSLQVKVVDRATQAPLKDAMVRLTWADLPRDYHTDAEGIATIRGLTSETWTLEVFAKGYAEGNEAIQLQGNTQTPVTIALYPGFELVGTVVDEEQQPLAGVGISVFPGDYRGQQIEYLKTDDDGKYRFANLPLKGLRLHLGKTGYSDERLDIAPLVTANEVQTQDFTLAKRPDGGSITGTVVDNAGKPLAGVKIANGGMSSSDLRETTTDAEGRYRLDDVFKGTQGHVAVYKLSGYAQGIVEFSPGPRDKPNVVDVKLSPGHRLVGRVVDEQGQPISGVYIQQGGRFGMAGRVDGSLVITGADGRFVFDTLPAGARFTLRKEGFSPINDDALPLDGDEEVVIKFTSQGVVRGRVVDAKSGESVKAFVVRINFSPDRTEDDPGTTLTGPAVTGDGEKFVSNEGEFEIGNFTRGMALQVTVEAPGYQRQVVRRVVAAAADVAKPVEFSLKPIDKSQLKTYAGKLVDDAGQGIAGVEVRLIVADRDDQQRDDFPFNWQMIRIGQLADQAGAEQFLAAVTDAQGWFEFRDVLPIAEVELAYWGPGIAQHRIDAADKLFADDQLATITATAAGSVSGKIDEKTFPQVDSVTLGGGSDFFRSEFPGKEDSYLIPNVPPGKYELQVYRRKPIDPGRQTDGYETEVIHRQPIEVKSKETTVVNLDGAE